MDFSMDPSMKQGKARQKFLSEHLPGVRTALDAKSEMQEQQSNYYWPHLLASAAAVWDWFAPAWLCKPKGMRS